MREKGGKWSKRKKNEGREEARVGVRGESKE